MAQLKNNKWLGGKTSWNPLSLPAHVLKQACAYPVQAILDEKIGTETVLCLVDPTDFVYELASTHPFCLSYQGGLIDTEYGPVAFFLFQVKESVCGDDTPVATFELTVDPFNEEMIFPFYDLALQTHWHVFLLDGQGNEVKWFEFENIFNLAVTLEFIEKAIPSRRRIDFLKAKELYQARYSFEDLLKIGESEPHGLTHNHEEIQIEILAAVIDLVCLVYHEARNVRHPIKKGLEKDSSKYARLISLPRNRIDAWNQMERVRNEALKGRSILRAIKIFENEYGVSLDDLVNLFYQPFWKDSLYGGNKWGPICSEIAILVIKAIQKKENDIVANIMLIHSMRHNTGSVAEKIKELNQAINAESY